MSNIILESANAKINRANETLRQLEFEIQSAELNKAHICIAFCHESAGDELVLTYRPPSNYFVRYAILAGEVIHQARSALDHAIWELHPNPVSGKTGFPVYRVKSDYKYRGLKMIDGINPNAVKIIEELQPFGLEFETNTLYLLHELWNRDKHRLLNTCLVITHGVSLRYRYPDGKCTDRTIKVPEDIVYGTELFRGRHPGKEVEIMAEVLYSSLRFEDELIAHESVLELLTKLVGFSRNTILSLVESITR